MNQEDKSENKPEENGGGENKTPQDENKRPEEKTSHAEGVSSEEKKSSSEEAFEEKTAENEISEEDASEEEIRFQKLYKSRKNKIVFGVCGGLGKYFNVDPVIFRLLFILSLLLGGWGLLVYFIAGIIIPYDPEEVIETDAEQAKQTFENTRENTRIVIGLSLILLGLFALLRSTGLIRYFTFFGLTNEIIMPVILIAIGIFLIYRQNFEHSERLEEVVPVSSRLHLSANNRKISGVCGGLGEYFGVDPNLIRILWLIFTFSSFGVGIVVYILFAVIVPKEERGVSIE